MAITSTVRLISVPAAAGFILGLFLDDFLEAAEFDGLIEQLQVILPVLAVTVVGIIAAKSSHVEDVNPTSWRKFLQIGSAIFTAGGLLYIYSYFVGFAPAWEKPIDLTVIALMFAGTAGMLMALLKRKPWQQ